MEFPSFTRSLRANTDLDKKRNLTNDAKERAAIELFRKKQSRSGVTWKELKLFINDKLNPKQSGVLLKQLRDLWELSREMVGSEENTELIDEAAITVLRMFIDQKVVLVKHSSQLKKIFGPVANALLNKMCTLVYDISGNLTEDCREYLKEKEVVDGESSAEEEMWGNEIDCELVFDLPKYDHSKLTDLSIPKPMASKTVQSFSMQYEPTQSSQSEPVPGTSKGAISKQQQQQPSTKYTRAWLAQFVPAELLDNLIELLRSAKTNDELQIDLFDFLGIDYLDLITEMLQNRKQLIESAKAIKTISAFKEKAVKRLEAMQHAPAYLMPVKIQSESEKQLRRQVNKEEKKLKKFLNVVEQEEEACEELDPLKLRVNYQQSLLLAAQMKPLLLNDKPRIAMAAGPRQSSQRVKYPNVYDSYSEARNHVGFIAGNKIVLPENVERTDNKLYEEVKIPATDPPPLSIGSERIRVEMLDEIGQIAFKGCKELNRIQSVVFNTAYNSNENLLVCAPTGAGKTNVAMLTIVNTIRQFVDQGVIHRDQFKIVYVAPMKALAAEMTSNFGKRLQPLNILVRELTGDMQLTKAELGLTQMIVTTPEKWDVMTRKGAGDVGFISLVKLLIIDEVHLLHGERGPVVEALVARTLRLVESSQSMIRIVGLSATLPNYIDVARFLRVNPMIGLFFFDSRFRPVPLSTNFIGVKTLNPMKQLDDMNTICYERCIDMVRQGHQVMVFVHARNATVRTATLIRDFAQQRGHINLLVPESNPEYGMALKVVSKSRNKQFVDLFQSGLAMHNAGMLRSDRNLVEKYFADGLIKILVCTATLAWGVNLPAHAVIIKGTEIYDAKHGSFVDLGILDVLQIFGRAGRPQFDKSGVGTIITTHDKLNHYLSLLTNQFPIESNFVQCLADNLNAEVTLGTISNVDEAIVWLSYTYLFVRMRMNPQCYGLHYQDLQEDPTLERKRRQLIHTAAMALDKARMVRYNERTGDLNVTDLGRTASHFYIKYDTVEVFNEMMKPIMTDSEILNMMANAQEFQQLKVRDDEMDELDELTRVCCEVPVRGGSENIHGKVNILMQTYLSKGFVRSFSLMSDMSYITQNAARIARALFTIVLRANNPILASRMLNVSKMFEKQMWESMTPMYQFGILPIDVVDKIEKRGLSILALRDMDEREIGDFLRNQRYARLVKQCAAEFPMLEIDATLQPITRTVLRIRVSIEASFRWNDRVHGKTAESFWIWIEDPESNYIYHSESFLMTKRQTVRREVQELVMTIPLKDPLPPQYYIRVASDTWLGSNNLVPLSFKHLILPEIHPPHTELLELQPLPVSVLNNLQFESLYNFTHYNPIQTQIFHCLYHTDNNVLLGAPTGSGKTIAAEMAMFRVFRMLPTGKVVYIAPLKALVKERMDDWKVRLEKKLGKKVVELTGDVTPDIRAIKESSVIVTTPEKWDGISRSWQTRDYVRDVALIVIDEIHLLGEDRGPVLEVIVSRMNFISSHTERKVRIVGLSTALANAVDLGDWLGIGMMGLYNFKPSVRPVPLTVHIQGFPGKHYCPRMATMNRPAFQAIRQYSPCTPALIFVASRRQTRLTAMDLINFLAVEDNPKQFLHTSEEEMDQILQNVRDNNLRLTLAFGIGMHHAGLHERDRKTSEELFLNRKIQILVATATLAWGVNLPAHLVIIKGTEFYDGKLKRYVDMPITDVLQMMGRAGRPQFGNEGIACVYVHDVKKNFYKKFLYDPFPVESSLLAVLPDHINAEIVSGTLQTKQAIMDYLTWTYFYRRLLRNPTYYDLESPEMPLVNQFLSELIEGVLDKLMRAGCVVLEEDNRSLVPTSMGRIASYYYLSHTTMRLYADTLRYDMSLEELLRALADATEFAEHPVRHNEDVYNGELAKICPLKVDPLTLDNPHTKVFLLLQAHLSRLPLPNTDYGTDTKSVLDQAIRIIQAMIDISAEQGWLATTLRIQQLMQCIIQARWLHDPVVMSLPNVESHNASVFKRIKTDFPFLVLPGLKETCSRHYEKLAEPLRQEFDEPEIEQIHKVLSNLPSLNIQISIRGPYAEELDVERLISQPQTRDQWLEIYTDQEYVLNVQIIRLGSMESLSIHCPKFPKGKDEGWFLTLGHQAEGEVIALKRCVYRNKRSTHQLCFYAPRVEGRRIYTLYLLSDGYLGMDQQYNVQFDVIKPPEDAACAGAAAEFGTGGGFWAAQ
ncbi:activating signal cointegrator 1 complex subunit 3-like [Anopheles albimanus]|uniref:Activating signal cointegrator 1 complex subunit 3 n=1 Tax=Anopheles albimanus TaxID=7167 RepID=A0A182FS15_ANOAL|nr:activating signal cointegrator 1 complex subunit 3-like [Anopheles albimanus]